MNEEITLDQFVFQLQTKIDTFKAVWIKEQLKDPKNYPSTMSFEDWFEQFECDL